MKTLVLTGSEQSMHEVLDLTIPSKQAYAVAHGYDFMSIRSFQDDQECGFSSKHIGFQRMVTSFKLLRFYQNVMWVDADAVITNNKYKIEDFIQGNESLIASYDWMHYTSFSTGNFIVRKTIYTEQLFNMFLNVSKHRLNDIMAEQGTLNQIYMSLPEYRHMFSVLPHKYLNSVPSFLVETDTWILDNNRSGIVEPWNSNSFLAHLTGTSTSERVQILTSNKLNLN